MIWDLRSQVNSPAEIPEEAACEGCSAGMAAAEGGSISLAEARSWSGDLPAVEGSSIAAEDEAASQALERLESAGEAACCLNDTFEVQLHARPKPSADAPCVTVPLLLSFLHRSKSGGGDTSTAY